MRSFDALPAGSEGLELWAQRAVEVLRAGGLILYPTDTIWGIGCDATDSNAVSRVYALKQRSESKALLALVNSLEMLRRHVDPIPDAAFPFLDALDRPTTVIYPYARGLANNLLGSDGSVGLRWVRHALCERIISLLGNPLVSTSANPSGVFFDGTLSGVSPSIVSGVDLLLPASFAAVEPQRSSRIVLIDNSAAGYTILRD